ncbi:DUF6907 domain-containing protein [Streptomyces albus]|uniref:DUF6907 domain-containing protein n=1 Tax=Streptomyces albus TaxID=1888 RepID=UPI0033ED2FEA
MTVSVSMGPVEGSADGPRQSVTFVRGQRVIVECSQDWCTVDHKTRDERFFEDISHMSESVSVSAPVGLGHRREDILEGFLVETPFAAGPRGPRPVFAFDATGSGEFAELSKHQARAELDRIAAHIDRLRHIVDAMPDA